MKQNNIFSDVKRNICNSEGVDDNEQCGSKVKEATPPKRNKLWEVENGMTYLRYGFICRMTKFWK